MTRLAIALAAILLAGGCTDMFERASVIAPETLIVTPGDAPPVAYGAVITGSPKLVQAKQAAPIALVAGRPDCRTPKAGAGARIAYVYTYGGGQHTPLQHVNGNGAANIAAIRGASDAIKPKSVEGVMMKQEASTFMMSNEIHWTSRIDVLVTETEAPVFLYLNSYNSILWNIQLAPGAEIDGIVVNAYSGGAIANGTGEDRTAFTFVDGSSQSGCYVEPRGRAVPIEQRIASAREINPDFDPAPYRDEWKQNIADSRKFFASTLPRLIGGRPDWELNDAKGGSFDAVLVGPLPAAPFEAQPITRLQLPEEATPFWGTRDGAFREFGAKG